MKSMWSNFSILAAAPFFVRGAMLPPPLVPSLPPVLNSESVDSRPLYHRIILKENEPNNAESLPVYPTAQLKYHLKTNYDRLPAAAKTYRDSLEYILAFLTGLKETQDSYNNLGRLIVKQDHNNVVIDIGAVSNNIDLQRRFLTNIVRLLKMANVDDLQKHLNNLKTLAKKRKSTGDQSVIDSPAEASGEETNANMEKPVVQRLDQEDAIKSTVPAMDFVGKMAKGMESVAQITSFTVSLDEFLTKAEDGVATVFNLKTPPMNKDDFESFKKQIDSRLKDSENIKGHFDRLVTYCQEDIEKLSKLEKLAAANKTNEKETSADTATTASEDNEKETSADTATTASEENEKETSADTATTASEENEKETSEDADED